MRRCARRRALALCMAGWAAISPVRADWREDIGTFRIGILAEPGAGNAVAGLGELNDAFGKALGMKVEFLVANSYPALIDAQVSARIDYAIYTASAYAAAYSRCGCVEPLVAPVGEDGSIGFRSVLVARDGMMPSTEDLAGRRIAILPADSMAGHQLHLAAFRPEGRPLSGTEAFLVSASSAEEAEGMVARGDADALFGWVPVTTVDAPATAGGTIDRLIAAGIDRQRLDVVWQSEVLRYGPHAVSSALHSEAKEKLTIFLTGLKLANPNLYERLETHRLGGFTPASHADYLPALDVAKILSVRP